jgi:hypothetical protein
VGTLKGLGNLGASLRGLNLARKEVREERGRQERRAGGGIGNKGGTSWSRNKALIKRNLVLISAVSPAILRVLMGLLSPPSILPRRYID